MVKSDQCQNQNQKKNYTKKSLKSLLSLLIKNKMIGYYIMGINYSNLLYEEPIIEGGKNKDYYEGKRFFKVSRRFYREYTSGYFFGYYHDDEFWDKMELQETRELALRFLQGYHQEF